MVILENVRSINFCEIFIEIKLIRHLHIILRLLGAEVNKLLSRIMLVHEQERERECIFESHLK